MLRTEGLGDVPNGITLHDLVQRVKAEGWDPKQVEISAFVENWDYAVLEVARQWDDGVLPPVPVQQPLPQRTPPTGERLNPDLLDLPDLGDVNADPLYPAYGPTAPRRPAPEQARPSLLRRALSWKDRAR